HSRARRAFDGATVKTTAGFDGVIKKLGLGFIAFLNAVDSSERFNPFENESYNINREGRRSVVKRFFLDVRSILEKRRKVLVGALGKVFADNDDSHSGRAEILLRACKDKAKLLHINGS